MIFWLAGPSIKKCHVKQPILVITVTTWTSPNAHKQCLKAKIAGDVSTQWVLSHILCCNNAAGITLISSKWERNHQRSYQVNNQKIKDCVKVLSCGWVTCVGWSPRSAPVTAGIDSNSPNPPPLSVPHIAGNIILGYTENIEKISGIWHERLWIRPPLTHSAVTSQMTEKYKDKISWRISSWVTSLCLGLGRGTRQTYLYWSRLMASWVHEP